MIKLAVSLFFALCLTLASSAHLVADELGAIAYAPVFDADSPPEKCTNAKKTAVSLDGQHFCLAVASHTGQNNLHRCQIDISPVTLLAEPAIRPAQVTRLDQFGLRLHHEGVEPALEPPRLI